MWVTGNKMRIGLIVGGGGDDDDDNDDNVAVIPLFPLLISFRKFGASFWMNVV